MIKRLIFDIEVSPYEGWFYKPGYQINLGYHNIIKEAKIICICYKWEHSPKVYSLEWSAKQCDKQMLKDFLVILNQADEIVGHNSDRFDVKWIRTRCYIHDIPMMPNYVSVDTYKGAKAGFYFPNNKLDSISKYSGNSGKIKTRDGLEYEVWKLNNRKALKEYVAYCKQDVLETEKVYKRMAKYLKPKTSIATYRCNCPECNSDNTSPNKYTTRASGIKVVVLLCLDCGRHTSIPLTTYNREIALKKKKEDYADMKKGLKLH